MKLLHCALVTAVLALATGCGKGPVAGGAAPVGAAELGAGVR